jgi:3-oxoacyl-[acyl-carrier protein] reductase
MQNPMSLEGHNILVTGAAQGIGKAVAQLCCNLGAHVSAVDLKAAELQALVDELGADRVTAYAGSVADPDFVQSTVDSLVQARGEIHGLVNNAGIVRAAMINKMTPEQWQQVIDVNLSGVFYCLQAVGRHMWQRAEQGSTSPAAIVNVSSDAGRRGTIGQINYGAAKSGVLGITMSAAREWGTRGIRVNSVCFGVVETEMTETVRSEKFRDTFMAQIPMRRFSAPEEASQPIAFLLSQAASYITGQHLSVNGGYTIGV